MTQIQIQALPKAISAFLAATTNLDTDSFIGTFADSAILNDEAIEHHGKDAIRQWSDSHYIGAKLRITTNSADQIDGQTVVSMTLGGDFSTYGITAQVTTLDFFFTLTPAGDQITALLISDLVRGKETMNAVWAAKPNFDDPFSGYRFGKRQVPDVPAGWVKVKVTTASLNWHDVWTLRGVGHPGLEFPRILGMDGCGTLEDGSAVILYPVLGASDWKGDETLDPDRHVLSDLYHGTLAEYIVVPKRNAVPLPSGLSAVAGAVLGTAWLTAYRMIFIKSGLRPGQLMLVQGASGGVSTALIQLGVAAGMQVWVTGRTDEKRQLAASLGAHRTFATGEKIPRKADAVFDGVGAATWQHTMASVCTGGTIVCCGINGGDEPPLNLRKIIVEQISIKGAYVGTLEEFKDLIAFVVTKGIEPSIGKVLPVEKTEEGLRDIWDGTTSGKTVIQF